MYSRSIFHSKVTSILDGDKVKYDGPFRANLRTTAGADVQAQWMGSATQPAPGNYIAVSADTATPLVGDTTVPGEITSGGLSRALASYAHTSGTANYTESYTFTATSSQTVNKEGVLNAASSGTLIFESKEASPISMNNGDQISVTCSVNY